MRERYSSNLAFNDLLFNALLGFVTLFILVLLLINPISKNDDIPAHAEIMLILEWDGLVTDDIDIWVQGPEMKFPLSFQNKTSGFMHLDRDDLGSSSDTIMISGTAHIIKINREVVNMRGIMPGDYFVNVHVYSKKGGSSPTRFTVSLVDINPYQEVIHVQHYAAKTGQLFKLPAFTVDDEGNISDIFISDMIIPRISLNGIAQ
jgi:hypothetical protein